jgi:hypothetical protein
MKMYKITLRDERIIWEVEAVHSNGNFEAKVFLTTGEATRYFTEGL